MTAPDFSPAAIQQEQARVLGLLEDATPGEWQYRPWEHDDWGTVRGEDGHIVALARDSRAEDEEKAVHRAVGTDPYAANALLIAAAPALARDYAEALGEVERLRAVVAGLYQITAPLLWKRHDNGTVDLYAIDATEFQEARKAARAALASAPEERP